MTPMNDRSTDALLKALNDAMTDAALDLDTVPYRSRPGFESAKREAAQALPRLRAEYAERIFSNPLFFFPVGDSTKATTFAVIANEEGGTFTANVDALYTSLALRVEPTLGARREFTTNQLITLNDAIDDVVRASHAQDANLALPTNALKSLDAVPTFEALVAHCRALIEAAHGNALTTLYVGSLVVEQALATDFTAKTLAVVVLNTTESIRKDLAGNHRSTVVEVDSATEIDKAFAITIFKNSSSKRDKDSKTGRKPIPTNP